MPILPLREVLRFHRAGAIRRGAGAFRPFARRGLTLTEILVALAVASVFFLSALVGFTQILRASEEAEAEVGAANQARAVLRLATQDLAAVRRDTSTPQQYFLLENRTFAYGDGKDNDRDGLVDEDPQVDGRDGGDDAANRWSAARDDRHALINGIYERARFVGYPDLGDANIDEDCHFGNDRLTLRIPPDPLNLDTRDELITYEIGSYTLQGHTMDHVLLRTLVTHPGQTDSTTTREPVAFNVLSFDVLAWNPNNDSTAPDTSGGETRALPYWTTSWDARERIFPYSWPWNAPAGTPPLEFPASIYVSITVYSGRLDFDTLGWNPGDPVETLTLSTTVDLEPVLRDLRYERYLR